MGKERRARPVALAGATLASIGALLAGAPSDSRAGGVGADAGVEVLHGAHVMHVNRAHHRTAGRLLGYQGGQIQTAGMVFLVFWGSQWNNNDPSGEAALLQNFFNGTGGSSWNETVTQYCEGVATGTTQCGASGTAVGNYSNTLGGVWFDNAVAAPAHPKQSAIAAEAVRAAAHFGGVTPNMQFVVATATGNNSTGFGSSYCAYHSSTSSPSGEVAYTNLPYITDAGANCGAGFNGLGPNAGITIVAGHEFAESETDPFPNTGWVDGGGAEIGDKCAWIGTGSQGAAGDVALSSGSFPVQSLWSNAFGGGAGGCVLTYP